MARAPRLVVTALVGGLLAALGVTLPPSASTADSSPRAVISRDVVFEVVNTNRTPVACGVAASSGRGPASDVSEPSERIALAVSPVGVWGRRRPQPPFAAIWRDSRPRCGCGHDSAGSE